MEIDKSQLSYSWEDMADLTHASQVEIFGWCSCEGNEDQTPYKDCPRQWYTKDYLCPDCDSNIVITTKSDELKDRKCMECNGELILMSSTEVNKEKLWTR